MPCSISSAATSFMVFTGMAKLSPSYSITPSEGMPTSSPRLLSSAPPDMPGLIAASVCIIAMGRANSSMSRSSALTTPTDTVP